MKDETLTTYEELLLLASEGKGYTDVSVGKVAALAAKAIEEVQGKVTNAAVQKAVTPTAPTSGQIAVYDGTSGQLKSSGFTIATSVPSGAKFTDTNTAKASATATVGSVSGWSAGTLPTLGTAIAADDITAWSAGTLPTLGTAIPADDITAWSAGTAASASVSKGVLTITNGTAPSLTYAAKSIPNVTAVGTLPTLSYTARSIPNVTAVGSLPSLTVTDKTVVTGVST